jgi:hypothetical protein
VYNLDLTKMPPFHVEEQSAEVPAGGSAYVDGTTVPEDENWLLVGVTVYVPHVAPCYAVLQMEPVAGSGDANLDLAMTKNLPAGDDPDLLNAYVNRAVLVPGGGRIRAFVKVGASQGAGTAWLSAHYLRYPRNAMPRGM